MRRKKIFCIGGRDPYEIARKEWSDSVELWPAITHIHIGMYLLLTPSPHSQEELQKPRLLAGWVREVAVKQFEDKCVVIGKVRTSSI